MKFNIEHQTHFETAAKFVLLFTTLVVYFFYLSYKHDFSKGAVSVALTWSFFVLCTPIADAGFLLDFPLRLLFGIRMIVTEVFVWILAISITILTALSSPSHFETTIVTRLFYKIICHPYPYWSIIALCFIGTFSSIYFGDEMIDVIGHHERIQHHKHGFKHRVVALLAVTLLVVFVYYQLLNDLGVQIENWLALILYNTWGLISSSIKGYKKSSDGLWVIPIFSITRIDFSFSLEVNASTCSKWKVLKAAFRTHFAASGA